MFSVWFSFIPFSPISRMKDHAAASVSDEEFAKRAEKWQIDTPDTKEGYYIRQIFESMIQYLL
jgi:asparagine synthase (glutamine-hydrolysing)